MFEATLTEHLAPPLSPRRLLLDYTKYPEVQRLLISTLYSWFSSVFKPVMRLFQIFQFLTRAS